MNNTLKFAALAVLGTSLFTFTAFSSDEGSTFNQKNLQELAGSPLTPSFPEAQAPAEDSASLGPAVGIDKRYCHKISNELSNPVLKGSAIK